MAEEHHITLPITGMTCANCSTTIERNLKKLDGVKAAAVNLANEKGQRHLRLGSKWTKAASGR